MDTSPPVTLPLKHIHLASQCSMNSKVFFPLKKWFFAMCRNGFKLYFFWVCKRKLAKLFTLKCWAIFWWSDSRMFYLSCFALHYQNIILEPLHTSQVSFWEFFWFPYHSNMPPIVSNPLIYLLLPLFEDRSNLFKTSFLGLKTSSHTSLFTAQEKLRPDNPNNKTKLIR